MPFLFFLFFSRILLISSFLSFLLSSNSIPNPRAPSFSLFFGAAEEVEAFACMTLGMRVVQQIPDLHEPKWDGCVWFSKSSPKGPSF